jgi:hypothetical protein
MWKKVKITAPYCTPFSTVVKYLTQNAGIQRHAAQETQHSVKEYRCFKIRESSGGSFRRTLYSSQLIPLSGVAVQACQQRWAAILKNVSIKAIQIQNFWEKNRLKRYNFVGQNFFHRWSDRKNQTKIFSAPMKRYNIPRYKNFTDEATQLPSILENVSITAF